MSDIWSKSANKFYKSTFCKKQVSQFLNQLYFIKYKKLYKKYLFLINKNIIYSIFYLSYVLQFN